MLERLRKDLPTTYSEAFLEELTKKDLTKIIKPFDLDDLFE
jgi:hypothetical protein